MDLPPALQAKLDMVQDVHDSGFLLQQDFKYPIDAHGSVLDMNQINHLYPDVLPAVIHHLIRCGWRRVEEKRLIKQRPVKAPGFYEDLVTYVPIDAPDDVIEIDQPAAVSDQWSVKPVVTETFEERA
jgi:hypothetical protein